MYFGDRLIGVNESEASELFGRNRIFEEPAVHLVSQNWITVWWVGIFLVFMASAIQWWLNDEKEMAIIWVRVFSEDQPEMFVTLNGCPPSIDANLEG